MPKIFLYLSSLIGILFIFIGGLLYSFVSQKNNPQSQINTVQETNNQEEKKEGVNNNSKPVNQEKKRRKENKKELEEKAKKERDFLYFLYITMLVAFVLLAFYDIFREIIAIRKVHDKKDVKKILIPIITIIIQILVLLCSSLIKGKTISIIMFAIEILIFISEYFFGERLQKIIEEKNKENEQIENEQYVNNMELLRNRRRRRIIPNDVNNMELLRILRNRRRRIMSKFFIYIGLLIGILFIFIIVGLYFFLSKKNNNQPQINTAKKTFSRKKKEKVNNNSKPVNQEKKEETNQEETNQEETNQEEENQEEENQESEEKIEEEKSFLHITMLVVFALFVAFNIFNKIVDICRRWNSNNIEDRRIVRENFLKIILQTSMLLCSPLIKRKKNFTKFVIRILFFVLSCWCH